MHKYTLPWPPSVNHYYYPAINKITKKPMIAKTSRALKYRNDVYVLARTNKTLFGRIYLHVIAYPPANGRHDLDNLLKALCDALEYAKVYKNDSQIDRIIIERGKTKTYGEIEVKINPITKFLLIP